MVRRHPVPMRRVIRWVSSPRFTAQAPHPRSSPPACRRTHPVSRLVNRSRAVIRSRVHRSRSRAATRPRLSRVDTRPRLSRVDTRPRPSTADTRPRPSTAATHLSHTRADIHPSRAASNILPAIRHNPVTLRAPAVRSRLVTTFPAPLPPRHGRLSLLASAAGPCSPER